jgi:hypothetical protein
MLWPVASSLPLIWLPDIGRDAIIFIAAAYPSRREPERSAFETALVEWLGEDPEDEQWRVSLAARILSTVPDEALVTAGIRALKARLDAEGRLTGNRPYVTFEFGAGENHDIVDELLRDEGADLSRGPDKTVRDPTRELEALTREATGDRDATQLAALWAAVLKVLATLDEATDAAAHAEVQRAGWGAVAGAVEKITDAEAYAPGSSGHPDLGDITALIDRLAASRYPELKPDQRADDGFLAWGNWDVRVYAASALMDLCRRFGRQDRSLIGRLDALAFDQVPTVRLQVAQSLNTLWDVARDRMWELAERIGRQEQHLGVLGFFVSGPLRRVSEPEPERAEVIASEILSRIPRRPDEQTERAREPAAEAIAALAARLWIGRNRPAARSWIDDWIADLVPGEAYLWKLLFTIRMGLFESYLHPRDQTAASIQHRSKELADRVVRAANQVMRESLPELQREDARPEERSRAETRYQVAARLLDHVMNQLYFGSGVFRRGGSDGEGVPGLPDCATKRAFLSDYSDMLDIIGQAGTAHTLHHLLELYGYLADAAPETVFDRLAELLIGPASREGYHFESLGSDALVRLVRRYLADHREVFEDVGRRARLVEVLELFSEAGWPEALKLLYELPDLLR